MADYLLKVTTTFPASMSLNYTRTLSSKRTTFAFSTATTSGVITASTGTPTSQNAGIPPRAVAGISIGTAVIGAVIALLAVWIFLGKRISREHGAKAYSWTKVKAHPENEKGFGTPNAAALENNLLERADDSEIRKLMQDLNEMIDQ
jgi:hypothetical protein